MRVRDHSPSPRPARIRCVTRWALAACSDGGQNMAAVMCGEFVDRRLGVEVEHDGPLEGATVEGAQPGPFVVQAAFTEPATGARTSYSCTIEQAGDEWRLLDLTTSR